MGRRDTVRTFRRQGRVIHIVAEMGQPGLFRLHAGDPFERLVEMRMRRMRRFAKAVDQPDIDAFEHLEGIVAEFVDVGRIGKAPKPEP